MPTTEQVQVHGLSELSDKLTALKGDLQRKSLNRAARAGMNVFKEAILANLRAALAR